MRARPVLIMAGGTGGHVFPGLAVAECLRDSGIPVLWIGSSSGMENRIVPSRGFRLQKIDVSGIRRKGLLKLATAPLMILRALIQSLLVIRRSRPALVLGMGGFVSGPGGVAAWLLGVPLVIHEQNAVAGLTNRLLAPLATLILEGFPGVFECAKARYTGNPVRHEIVHLAAASDQNQQSERDGLRLLVLGGSRGARIFNETVPRMYQALAGRIRLDIWHQCGEQHVEATRAAYAGVDPSGHIRVEPFIEDMAAAYDWADIVLCRAGALTVAELSIAGIASILVPYPHAVDDHQTVNARHLADQGGAILTPESGMNADSLAEILVELSGFPDRLAKMAARARALAKPDAARGAADLCLEVMHA